MERNLQRRKQKKLSLSDKLKENNTVTRTVSVIFLILILAGLFAFIIIGLRSYGLFRFPAFLENIFSGESGDDTLIRAEHSGIYDLLPSERAGSVGFALDISLETVRGLIAGINLPDNLHLETTAEYFMDGAVSRTAVMTLWRKGNRYRYNITSNGVLEETYINDGTHEYIRNHITRHSISTDAGANFSFANVPHIKDINYYLDLLESGRIARHRINHGIYENIIMIRYEIEEFGQREYIEISLETGLVLSVRSYVDNILFYRSGTSVIEAYFTGYAPDNTAITDALFRIR